MKTPLELLRDLFIDRPDALEIFTLESLKAAKIKEKLRDSNELFAAPVNMYLTGRTGVGKTALGNCLLNGRIVMKSTGMQDCDQSVEWFKLGSNLRYYDLPGIGSDGNRENINRAALLMSQLEDEFECPSLYPLTDEDTLNVLDFSNCKKEEDRPEQDNCSVGQWQSPENQSFVAPDVIIYLLAPDRQFLRSDRKYLVDLLRTWKERKQQCIIITALNIFRDRDGSIRPTSLNIESAHTEISKIYTIVHKYEWIPPIVEINSITGEGIERLTEIICQVLPGYKIGNIQTVLKDELKHYAEQEQSNRYYRSLSLIAGRLARYKSDHKIAGQNIFQLAASAISTYSVMTFKGVDTVADLRNQIDDIAEQAEQIKKQRQQEIKIVKPIYECTEVEYITYERKEITEKLTEYIPILTSEVVTLKETQWVPGKVKKEIEWHFGDGLQAITRTVKDSQGKIIRAYYEKEEDGMVEKEVPKQVLVPNTKLKEITKNITRFELFPKLNKKIEQTIVGYEEQVVGTEFLSGGYPAIQLLLGIGLGVQSFCSNSSADWQTSLEKGQITAERNLFPCKSKIEELVENPDGENKLIEILEAALIGNIRPKVDSFTEDKGYFSTHYNVRQSLVITNNVNIYVTGRNGAGKTALRNCLFPEKAAFISSTGFDDCNGEVGRIKLANNLYYYQLPGISSSINFENINRATLLMPLLEDEFAYSLVYPLTDEDTFDVLDFSNCKKREDCPVKTNFSLRQWQSPENQSFVTPDVIVYVLASQIQFLQPEEKYLGELLKAWKKRKQKCVVITALNIFRNEDGSPKATPQNMEYARTRIIEVYQAVHKDEWIPPIIEINSKTGEGVNELMKIICQVLAADKISIKIAFETSSSTILNF